MKKNNQISKQRKSNKLKWKNLNISVKYLSAFAVTALLFLIASFVVYSQLTKTEDNVASIEEQNVWVNEMTELISLIQLKDVQIADYLLTESSIYIDQYHTYTEELNSLMEQLKPTLTTQAQKESIEIIQKNDENINQTFFDKMVPAMEEGRIAYATSLRNTSTTLRNENSDHVNQLIESIKKEQQDIVHSVTQNMNNSTLILVIANLSVVIIGTILMAVVSRRIRLSLNNLVQVTNEVANGNLKVKAINYQGKDEIGRLSAAVDLMKENMNSILNKVSVAAKNVSDSSEGLTLSSKEVKEGNMQIAQTMEEISKGAETQANGAGNLADNMNQFVQRVNLSEQSGKEIAINSENVLALTNEGTILMKNSVNQMKRIDSIVSESVDKVKKLDKQSGEISNLVLVIKGIADQTNLLSLNAAIEAARAGEHGKGFAVVADEVRKLSDQVSASVEEIKSIVTNIQFETAQVVGTLSTGYTEVNEGTEQMESTGKNFESINIAVTDMATKIAAISTNLKDIAANSNNMNSVIEEIASVSEESAAGVEQAAASAQQTASSMEEVAGNADVLAELAEQLTKELEIFKL
ncbi:methyl-accepting chemotaxis protein [Oceanobacillus halophilus]|uniref:Methyl-accepting chemotaxis protein n=1 Tax=Oceanobacillus halophilus TaxID=930130 RepID=A0A495A144_9BACI|nr:methyl-accepting chemotaxis protein [Oceanobacillus halophilus]RKQ33190.1 methyl-accepting chemotaxis protein [Oceanobacillus halophilus]